MGCSGGWVSIDFYRMNQARLRVLWDGCCKDNCRMDVLTYEEDEAMAAGALVVL